MRLCYDIETNGLLHQLSKIHIIAVKDVDNGDALHTSMMRLIKL